MAAFNAAFLAFRAAARMREIDVGAVWVRRQVICSVVINQSADTREMSEASNLGYEILRKQNYAAVANTCSSPAVSPAALRPNSLPKPASATVSMCKPYTDSSLIRVVVTVKYGSDGGEVSHATYLGG